jgi:hypothetical protein
MPVVQSDQDSRADIDISSTKTKSGQRSKDDGKMEIVRDESAEERIARLQTEVPKMAIIRDDSLGEVSGTSLNAGNVRVPSPENAGRRVSVEVSVDTEGLPADVEVAKMPTFVKTETVSDSVEAKRGPGRPRKAVQVKEGE